MHGHEYMGEGALESILNSAVSTLVCIMCSWIYMWGKVIKLELRTIIWAREQGDQPGVQVLFYVNVFSRVWHHIYQDN